MLGLLGTWDFGNTNCRTVFVKYMNIKYLDPFRET